MAKLMSQIRFIAGALALTLVVALSAPVPAAAQSGPNAATSEQQLLQQLKGGVIAGQVSIPDKKAANLEQPAGRSWQTFHTVTLKWIGGIVILGTIVLLAIFYLVRGSVRIEHGRSGRKMLRFNAFERFMHWFTAACFIVLALTGLNTAFGRVLLLPLIGPQAFAGLSEWGKYAHNFLSFPFTLGVVVIFFMWVAANIPNKVDVEWVKRGGGLIGKDHPPAKRFNAGQKAIFWIQMLGGTAMVVSGYLLIFPFYGTTIGDMQIAIMFHSTVAMLYIAVMLGHIYIGSLGMEGAFEAMGTGEVDVNWAKEHHSLWYEEEMSQQAPSGAMARPAE